MWPYGPALQPLWAAIDRKVIHPARCYRFTGYPKLYLYDWHDSTRAISEELILAGLHRSRTVLLVVSDGGAAIGGDHPDRVQGTKEFLGRWLGCVAQFLWLNPVPPERWLGTSAAAIQGLPGVRMIALADFDGVGVRQL